MTDQLSGSVVYLDANIVEDLATLRKASQGIDQAAVAAFRSGIQSGRFVVPFSNTVATELATVRDTDPELATELAAFYHGIASPELGFEPTAIGLRQSIEEALGGAPPRLHRLTPSEFDSREGLLLGRGPSILARIVAEHRAEAQAYCDLLKRLAGEVLAEIKEPLGQPLAFLIGETWPGVAPTFAEQILRKHRDWREGLRRTGRDPLDVRLIRAQVGLQLGIACAQGGNGREPDFGDYCDIQHGLHAAAVDAVLVTSDKRLRAIVDATPGRPLRAMKLPELLAD